MHYLIQFLVMDVDGTLTDGKVYIGSSGEMFKAFDVKDGLGIGEVLPKTGISPIIITGRQSEILERRCEELGISELYQGVSDKLSLLQDIATNANIGFNRFAYIGDDLNDTECMKAIKDSGGIVGCPADAVKQILEIADFISTKNGGQGAVREFIEWLLDDK
ncbi:HAD hydrolase family protein [Adlercreutzia sp. ZJ304]|uniref:KdsC family phosphatase n=1 Tax=Adlercreutzia sp. ZJ304 TaxID=2709791 RepID=UPI0013EC4765|nr:HAD hydrolase family protein [Adlercreutzia sp. ZJ304]